MMNEKKQNEIRVLAKYLRQECNDFESFTFAMKELFKGEAGVEFDNARQVVVYTGHHADVVQHGAAAPIVSDACIELESNYSDPKHNL